jgi:hypothetical protein
MSEGKRRPMIDVIEECAKDSFGEEQGAEVTEFFRDRIAELGIPKEFLMVTDRGLDNTEKGMMERYKLDENKKILKCDDLETWAQCLAADDRVVGKKEVGPVMVSTVFLGIDHNFGGEGDPVLFETMVFGGKDDMLCQRYCTWEEAEAGHKLMCGEVFGEEAEKEEEEVVDPKWADTPKALRPKNA